MKTNKYLYFVLCSFVMAFMSSCEPKALTEDDVLINDEAQLLTILQEQDPQGYKIYNINDFLNKYMTENIRLETEASAAVRNADAVIELFRPIREESERLLSDKVYLEVLYRQGAERAHGIATRTLRKVHKKLGFLAR